MSTAFDLILKSGQVYLDGRFDQCDIAIKDGKIVAMGGFSHALCQQVVDVSGLHLIPGAIDSQVHFREPGLTHKEDLESGSRSAVLGGVTTFLDEPNVIPSTTSKAALAQKIEIAKGRCWANFGFWIGATHENLDDLAGLEILPGVPGIGEVFMGSSTGSLLVSDDESLRKVLQNGYKRVAIHSEDEPRLTERKSLLSDHPHPREHPFLRDAESSRLATERILNLSAETGRPVHILHVSSQQEIPMIRDAKSRGLNTTCEITPQHLFFNSRDYERLGSQIQMNTPIREPEHQAALWEAVQSGLFDVFGSDHAPHTREEKAREYPQSPSGIPGVQTLLPLAIHWGLTHKIDLAMAIDMLTKNPAKLFQIEKRGILTNDFFADIVAVDLNSTQSINSEWLQSKCGWSPYEGETLNGRIVHTLVNGNFAVRDGELAQSGLGQLCTFGLAK